MLAGGSSIDERMERGRHPPPCGGQGVAGARVRALHDVNMHFRDDEGTVATMSPKSTEEVAMMM